METKFIAWVNGNSVAVGKRNEVEAKAREFVRTSRYYGEMRPEMPVTLKITTYGRQQFVKAIVLR